MSDTEGPVILLVDDEPVVREVTRAMLDQGGYRVHTADGGRRALETLSHHPDRFDLVILDLHMPDMDGDRVLEALHRSDRRPPVVISSGYPEEEVQPRFAGLSVAGFLQKPYDAKKLLGHVAGLIG